jgi:hypothetical protein
LNSLYEVLNFDATDIILQHSLIVSSLRVAKWWQNGKIGLIFNEIGVKSHEKRRSKYQFHYEFLVLSHERRKMLKLNLR